MRTSINTTVANRTVFGFGQDRVVSLGGDSYARAAQHLHSRPASKRARGMAWALKRLWSAAAAGLAPVAKCTCLAITGSERPMVRPMSPVVVVT